ASPLPCSSARPTLQISSPWLPTVSVASDAEEDDMGTSSRRSIAKALFRSPDTLISSPSAVEGMAGNGLVDICNTSTSLNELFGDHSQNTSDGSDDLGLYSQESAATTLDSPPAPLVDRSPPAGENSLPSKLFLLDV